MSEENKVLENLELEPGQEIAGEIKSEGAPQKRELSATSEMDYYLNGEHNKNGTLQLLNLSEEEQQEIVDKSKGYVNDMHEMMYMRAATDAGIDVTNPEELAKYSVKVVHKDLEGNIFPDEKNPADNPPNPKAELKEEIKVAVAVDNRKETNVIQFDKNKSFIENKDDIALLERMKNRKRRGSGAVGMLYNTNLKVKTYSMDKPLKIKAMVDGMQFVSITHFHSEKLLTELYDHTSVLTSDGRRMSSSAFYGNMSLEDLDDYLMYSLIASNKDGEITLPMMCTIDGSENFKETQVNEICKSKYKQILNLPAIFDETVTDEMKDAANLYDANKSTSECVSAGSSGVEKWVEIHNEDTDEVFVIVMKSPVVARYFELKRKIMTFTLQNLAENESMINVATHKDPDFRYKSLEDKLVALAEIDEETYNSIVEQLNLILYMDKVYIMPKEVHAAIKEGTMTYDKLIDGKDDVIVIPQNADAAVLYEFIASLDIKELTIINDKVRELSNKFNRPRFKFTTVCPHCGNRKSEYLSVVELFFIYLRAKSLMMQQQ